MISLNYRDSRPIYEQIKDGLRKLIVTGALSSRAIRNERPDWNTVADRDTAKLSSSAIARTFLRVFSETRSGLVNARETVDTDTCALSATS